MKRLDEKSGDEAKIDKLIRKLELQIVEEKLTKKQLENLQDKVDLLDEELEEPIYKLYELQAIIFYAENNKPKAMEFIEDAIKLEEDITKFSRTGALLAELYIANTVEDDIEDEPEDELSTDDDQENDDEDLPNIDVNKSFEKLDKTKRKQYEKIYKTLKNTGVSIQALGFVALYIPIIPAISLGSNLREDYKTQVALIAVIYYVFVMSYIYIGKYIESFYRPKISIALLVGLLMSLVGYFGILTLLVAIYAIISLFKIRKIRKDEYFIKLANSNTPVFYTNLNNIAIVIATIGWVIALFTILLS